MVPLASTLYPYPILKLLGEIDGVEVPRTQSGDAPVEIRKSKALIEDKELQESLTFYGFTRFYNVLAALWPLMFNIPP